MLDLIIEKIAKNFPNFSVFNEKISQEYTENCFIVWQNTAEYQKCMKNRYLSISEFSVFYHSINDLQVVADKLCEILCVLDDCKSQKISYEINENTLEVKVSYKFFVYKEEETSQSSTNMAKFDYKIKL